MPALGAPFDPRGLLRRMFDAAIAAAQPSHCVPPHLPPAPKGRLIVIGAGKASAAMARAVEDAWAGPLEGLVVTRYGYAVPCQRIEIVEAAHPVPDAAGLAAARRILSLAEGAGADDAVLCLISGGGSALLPLPLDGLTLADKQAVNRALLASGATIAEINCVRRHLSAIKGGRLAAAAYPAQGDDAADLRRSRRQSRATSPPARRSPTRRPGGRARDPAPLRHRRAAGGPRRARERARRDGEAGRPAPRGRRDPHRRHAADGAGGGRRGGAGGRPAGATSSAIRSRARRATSAR